MALSKEELDRRVNLLIGAAYLKNGQLNLAFDFFKSIGDKVKIACECGDSLV